MENSIKKTSRTEAFVSFIIEKIKDKGVAAILRRADNPATEYQSWDYLSRFVELDKSFQRLPFATIAAAIAKANVPQNGNIGIGYALSRCYEDGNKSDQAKAKLRRLLACDSVAETCRILRPIFSLIESRSNVHLNFSQLLNDLLRFEWNSQQVKSFWAQDFYNSYKEETV